VLAALRREAKDGARAAVVFSDESSAGGSAELFAAVHELQPAARRVLLSGRGEWSKEHPAVAAMRTGQVDAYIFVPWGLPERWLYWGPRTRPCRCSRSGAARCSSIRRSRGSRRRSGSPPSRSRPVRRGHRRRRPGRPGGGRLRRFGGAADNGDRAVRAGRPGRDELAHPQLPRLPERGSGRDLGNRALEQAWFFGARFVLARPAVALESGDGEHLLRLEGGGEVRARTVVITTGVTWHRLDVPSLAQLVGAGVYTARRRSTRRPVGPPRSWSAAGTRPTRRRCTWPARPPR